MKKPTAVAISLSLVICLMISFLSGATPVAAANHTLTNVTDNTKHILLEDTSRRKEYEKHFLMSDGSYQVALYNDPVHKLEGGNWVEIDNTLTLKKTRDGVGQYVTTNGLVDVSFAEEFGEQLVTIRQDDYCVSWGLYASSGTLSRTTPIEPNRSAQAEVITSDTSALALEEQKTLATKSSSTIQYRSALASGVDLEYIVQPGKIKENIILHSEQDISCYTVALCLENLSARLLESREIEFYNDKEVLFTMTSPYMYDSAGELSEDIAVEMLSNEEGCYYIKLTPDAQWLGSEDRVYPVVIDPQVSVNSARSNIIDNYVLEGSGNQNRNLDRLYIGRKSGKRARAFIKYDVMPTIPTTANITDATMSLTITSGTSTGATADAYRVIGDWESGTITWANQPGATLELAQNISHNNLTRYTFSCGEAVRAWYYNNTTGSYWNYGVMLRYSNESIEDYNAFYSADCSNESKRPSLVIYYGGSGGGTDFNSAKSLVLDNSQYIQTIGENEERYFKFIPPVSGEYLFYSSAASLNSDPYITVYSNSGTTLECDDNSGGNKNFRLVTSLTGGTSYYIGARHADDEVGAYNLNVLIACRETNISECHLMNVGSLLYIDIHGPAAQNLVHQWRYRGDASARWTIKKQSDGYYTIQSAYGDKRYIGVSSTNVGEDNICLYSAISDRTRWKIFVKSTGEMYIESKFAQGKALYAPSNAKDDELRLAYVSDTNTNLQWEIACQSNTTLEGQQMSNWCWVAAARIFAKHYYSPIELTQTDAVVHVKTEVKDEGGTTGEGQEAIEFLISTVSGASLSLQHVDSNANGKRLSEQALQRFINEGHVVYIARGRYVENERNGHAAVIVGYATLFEKGLIRYRYTIYDPAPNNIPSPWNEPTVTNGKIHSKSYAGLCNGKHAVSGEDSDERIWDGFITVNTSYSNQTLPPVLN